MSILSEIICEHPVIIRNKAAFEYLFECHHYYHKCRIIPFDKYHSVPQPSEVNVPNDWYIYDFFGRKQYLFIKVPCGHCDLCNDTKRRHLAFRFEAETAEYTAHKPLFVTCTYIPKYRPRGREFIDNRELRENADDIPFQVGVSKRDIRMFFKKLRNILYNDGLPTDFRYFCSGEYGTTIGKDHHPHYHVVFWNLPNKSFFDLEMWSGKRIDRDYPIEDWQWRDIMERYMRAAWCLDARGKNQKRRKKGNVEVEWIGESRKSKLIKSGSASGAARYAAKYIGKKYNPMHRVNDPFTLASNRNGGIGMKWIKDRMYLRESYKETSCAVINPYTRQVIKSIYPPQYKKYLYPTLSCFVNKQTKETLSEFLSLMVTKIRLCGLFNVRDKGKPFDDVPDFFNKFVHVRFKVLKDYLADGISFNSTIAKYDYNSAVKLIDSINVRMLLLYGDLKKVMDKYDPEVIAHQLALNYKRRNYFESLPPRLYDVEELAYVKKRQNEQNALRDTF